MSSTTTSVEEFDAIIQQAQVEKALADKDFSARTLVWLALSPFWSLSLAEKGFPLDKPEGGIGEGEEVRELFDRLERAGLIIRESDSGTTGDVIFVMPPAQKTRVITGIVSERKQSEASGLRYLQDQMVEISEHIISKQSNSERQMPLVLYRWFELARRASNFDYLSDYFTLKTAEILNDSIEGEQTSAPEALRWIEAFVPFVEIFGSQLEIPLTRARRQYEIFNRRAYDRRYLDGKYLIREEQDKAFLELLSASNANSSPWALHYVGKGGMGKTMLMRHINAQMAKENNLAVARVDFDYLNPDYPARQPGLLLLSFAVELSAYVGGSRGFQRFEKQVREWHRRLAFEKTDKDGSVYSNKELERLIYTFAGELERLGNLRPLLILDTCEELAKLRPDGSLSESVRVTFEVLERIHELMPHLRVVFSGRRPLAKKGYNWSLNNIGEDSPLDKLPARDYLRLHEIRGFNEEEADGFLAQYKNGSVPPKLFTEIRKLSVIEEKNAIPLFVFYEQNGNFPPDENSPNIKITRDTVRYNPFDLDIYAAWTAGNPDFSEEKLKAGAHFYIKERLVERVEQTLKKRLPEITLLGRFDRAILRELYASDDNNQFNVFFDELISQEWIDTERSVSSFPEIETSDGDIKDAPSFWGMHENMRVRLLAYYQEEKTDELKAANKQIALLLERITLERDWRDLSVAYFESAVQTLTKWDRSRAAVWWEKVEANLARTARWDWAYSLTDQLLADESVAGRKEESLGHNPNTENVLRAAILAARAAALIHLGKPDVLLIWLEISQKLYRHPSSDGRHHLKLRSEFGKNAAELSRGEKDPGMAENFIENIKRELTKLHNDEEVIFEKSPQMFASAIAAIEQATENGERIQKDNAGLIEDEQLNFDLVELKNLVFEILKEYSHPVTFKPAKSTEESGQKTPPELICFLRSLCGRLALLTGDWNTAKEQLDKSFSFINEIRYSDNKNGFQQIWLDWLSPENFEARIELEYMRGTSPRFYMPQEIWRKISPDYDGRIDSDKESTAALTSISYFEPLWSDVTQENLNLSESVHLYQNINPETKIVNAHNEFPPYFVSLIEHGAFSGHLITAVSQARELTPVLTSVGSAAQNDVDRTLARLAFWFNLHDERSYYFGESLKNSQNLDDIKLSAMLDTISNIPTVIQSSWIELYSDHALMGAASAYYHYRAAQLGKDSSTYDFNTLLFDKPARLDKAIEIFVQHIQELKPNFFKSAFIFAQTEFDIRKNNRGGISSTKANELSKLIRQLEDIKDYVGAFTLDVFLASLNNTFPSMANAKKIGWRRAAWIMVEEGILLSLRRPKAALAVLEQASELMTQIKDFVGTLIGDLSLGLLAIKLNETLILKRVVSYLEIDYGKLCRQETSLSPWSALTGCINNAINGDNPNEVSDFLNAQSENPYWRPTLVRILYCLAWDATSGAGNAAFSSLCIWIKDNYGRHEKNELILPAAFDFAKNPATMGTKLSEIECIISCDKLFDLNSPLTGPIDISLKTPSMITNEHLINSRIESKTDLSMAIYQLQSQILPAEIYSVLRQEIIKSSEDFLPLKISFPNAAAAAPWEAILAFSASETHSEYSSRLMYRRVLQRNYTPHTDSISAPAEIISYVADHYGTDLAYKGWNELVSDTRFEFEIFRSSETNLFSSNSTSLLHLTGVPIETHRTVDLEIISTDFDSADVKSYLEPLNSSRKARVEAASLVERFPQLRVVVVQCPSRFEEPRTPTDRFEIAKLRRFCADVFQTGVGAVIMLPSLNQELNVNCLGQLARLFSSPIEIRVEDVMRTVREIQEMIVESGHSNKNDAAELSFDVCLYMHDDFKWHVVENN